MKAISVLMLTVAVALELLVSHTSSEEANFKTDDYEHGLTETEVSAALEKAREINLLKKTINLFSRDDNNRGSARCPLSYYHGTRQYEGDTLAESKVNDALLAVRILVNESGNNYSTDLQQEAVREIFKRYKDSCEPMPGECDFESTYRNANGSCNNIQHPDWGMTGSIQQRVLPNAYDDYFSSPRTKGVNGNDLPNPRTISNVVHCNNNPDFKETRSDKLTLHVLGFGQFLTHDIARTPPQTAVDDCCKNGQDTDNCFNIIIPEGDDISKIFVPGYCMEVKRSATKVCIDDTSGGKQPARQQTNGLTSFIDASNVYGSSEKRQRELRDKNGKGFRIKTSKFRQQPRIHNAPGGCVLTNAGQHCSSAGDSRVNAVPLITTYHYLFVKEHNRIAEKIKGYYTDDEIIFQETRRIVIAIMQKIVYDEFLPSFFSPTGLKKYSLLSSENYVYEPDTNPTMINAFGIAFRLGHSWVSNYIKLFNKYFKLLNYRGFSKRTEDTFGNPEMTYLPWGFQRLAFYQSGRSSPETDNVLEEAVRSNLFKDEKNKIAFDLAALNIQRGRDHGLPPYNEYRKWCGLSKVNEDWGGDAGLVDHTPFMRHLLKEAGYESPLDIDLYSGGLSETPVSGGNLGPTFECITGTQYRRLKFGDRLFYQNGDAGFTSDQVAAIQNYTLSRVFCNNYFFNAIHHPSAFKLRDVCKSCTKIPDLDLSVFKPKRADSNYGRYSAGKRTSNNDRRLSTTTGEFSDNKEDLMVDERGEDTFNLDGSLDRMIEELVKTRENRNK